MQNFKSKSASDLSKPLNILEALYFIKATWNILTNTNHSKYFIKAGFKKSDEKSVGYFITVDQYQQKTKIWTFSWTLIIT